jgi:hypothetical protein
MRVTDTGPVYAAGRIDPVPNQPKTPNHVFRVSDELWHEYGSACEDAGKTRSEDLRAYMLRIVQRWKRRQATGEDEGAADGRA